MRSTSFTSPKYAMRADWASGYYARLSVNDLRVASARRPAIAFCFKGFSAHPDDLMTSFTSPKAPRRAVALTRATVLGCALVVASLAAAPRLSAQSIDSGTRWNDTEGNAIDAHGGGLLQVDDTYYWFGEIKRGPTELPDFNASWGGTRVPFTGVSCYSSKDLVHWKNEGNVLPSDPAIGDLRSDRVVERPKVIFNARTRRFVMWMHIDSGDYKEARTGVAVASSPRGPFRYLGAVRPDARAYPEDMPDRLRREFESALKDKLVEAWVQRYPDWRVWARDFSGGHMARDMALFVDDDGTAYQFYASEDNAVMHVSQLSDDYLSHAGKYRRITFDSREAPAPFKWKGRYYLVSSGCTGWMPNATRIHSADSIFGEWINHGSFFADDSGAASVSYLSQSTFVAVLGSDRLLFMADRWNKDDLQHSRYVWLPVDVAAGTPRVEWQQVWDISRLARASTRNSVASGQSPAM